MEDKTLTNIKYIGYARKSSEDNKERQAASLPEQIYVLEGMKSKDGLNVIGTFEESQSAHVVGRPVFSQILQKIKDGEANAILTWHENRLARNAYDAGQIVYLIDEGKLVEIRTPARIYHNTPGDKFMLQIELASSKKDSDDKSIVVSRGLGKKCRDGWRPGVAPQGYLNDKTTESGFRRIFIDPERFPYIQKIFQMYYDGTSVNEIHRIAKDVWGYRTRQKKRSGGGPLCISMIYKILTNPFYCGKYEYPEGSDKWYEGQHDKAVKEEVFDEIQVKLGRRSQYHLQSHQFAYTGSLVHCGPCDSAIVAEEKWQCICTKCKLKFSITKNNRDRCTGCGALIPNMDNPTILHYIYYRCGRKKNPDCKEKAIRIDRLEKQIADELSTIDISPKFMEWAIEQILKNNKNEIVFREDAIKTVKLAHDRARAKLDNLLQLKISPENKDGSLLSDEKYKSEKDVLEAEIKNLEVQLVDVDNRMIKANDQTDKAFTFAERALERFSTTDDLKVKRDIFMGLGLHLTLQDGIVRFDAPEYITEIKKMKKEAPIIGKRVAPEENAESTALTEQNFSSIPTLLRGWELNPACEIMSLTCSRTLPRI